MKKTKPVKTKDMILSGSVGTRKPDRTAISNTIYLESKLLAASSLDVKIEMNSNDINNYSKKDFLNISESYTNKKSIKNSKTSSQIQPYDQARKKLISIYYQKPTVEQIARCIRLMYKALSDDLGFLCREEIVAKIINDLADLAISKEQIHRMLLLEVD